MDSAPTSAFTAYRDIKQRIIGLNYRPGDRLSEASLADEFGIGRSPIRTALSRLEGEGWIRISPQSGTFVRALSAREVDELSELRAVLEAYCVGVAAQRISDDEIAATQAAFDACGPKVRAGDAGAFLVLDERFHELVYRIAGNSLITQTLVGLRDKVQWIRRACSTSGNRVQAGYAEIEGVFAALASRDAQTASAQMRAHVENAARFCQMTEARPRRPTGRGAVTAPKKA